MAIHLMTRGGYASDYDAHVAEAEVGIDIVHEIEIGIEGRVEDRHDVIAG